MKTITTERTCEIDAPQQFQSAIIADSPEMFSILYSKLYSKKEMAIVRELLANAWDAHLRAGTTDTPISIHMPTPLEPWYEIRDYGIGLSPENVFKLYMNYGFSDKSHSNDEIGGFGLGSKAPYCYTDQFTVVSYYEGMAYTFQAFLQSNGKPACVELDRRETNEPNGIMARVNVADTGISHHKFMSAMRELYPFIPTAPDLNIDPESERFRRREQLAELDVHKGPLHKVAVQLGERGVTFVQGIIPYHVDFSDIYDLFSADESSRADRNILNNMHFDLWVEIGTLPVTASREGLEMNDEAKQTIKKLLTHAIKVTQDHFTEQLNSATNWFEWAKASEASPIHTRVPQEYKDICTKTGSLFVEALGFDKSQAKGATFAHPAWQLNDGFRRNTIEHISVGRLMDAKIYVQPKASWPVKRFLKEKHFVDGETNHALILVGDLNTIKKNAKKLGLPHTIEEMPYLKAAKGSSQAQRRKLGAAEYTAWSVSKRADGTWTIDTFGDLTAKDFMDRMDQRGEDTAVFMREHLDARDLRAGLISGLFTTSYDHLWYLNVPDRHSRVIKTILNEYDDRVATSVPTEGVIDYSKDVLQAIHDHEWIAEKIEDKFNPRLLDHSMAMLYGKTDLTYTTPLSNLAGSIDMLGHMVKRAFWVKDLPPNLPAEWLITDSDDLCKAPSTYANKLWKAELKAYNDHLDELKKFAPDLAQLIHNYIGSSHMYANAHEFLVATFAALNANLPKRKPKNG